MPAAARSGSIAVVQEISADVAAVKPHPNMRHAIVTAIGRSGCAVKRAIEPVIVSEPSSHARGGVNRASRGTVAITAVAPTPSMIHEMVVAR